MDVYQPALGQDRQDTIVHCSDDDLADYAERELGHGKPFVTVPDECIKHSEEQEKAFQAEKKVFELFKQNEDSLQGVGFHRLRYMKRQEPSAERMTFTEHDVVVLISDQKKLLLLEVKSCDDTSKSKDLQGNKRRGERQLIQHIEHFKEKHGIQERQAGAGILWPFLGKYNDKSEERFSHSKPKVIGLKHAFKDTFDTTESFKAWLDKILNDTEPINDEEMWNKIRRCFFRLSCNLFQEKITKRQDNEVKRDLNILLSNEQYKVLHIMDSSKPIVIEGPAGSGKTLLMQLKLNKLNAEKKLCSGEKALVICGRNCTGLVCELEEYFKQTFVGESKDLVDVTTLPYTHEDFKMFCVERAKQYKFIFIDEAEDLKWYPEVEDSVELLRTMLKDLQCLLWLMIDENQLVSNLSMVTHFTKWEKPEVDYNLTKVYRSTKKVNDVCQSLLSKHGSDGGLNLAHETEGSQPSFVDEDNFQCIEEAACALISEFCGTKGFEGNDIFMVVIGGLHSRENHVSFSTVQLNEGLKKMFEGQTYVPQGIHDIKEFKKKKKKMHFCVGGFKDFKGLEAPVVVVVLIKGSSYAPEMVHNLLYCTCSRSRGFLYILTKQESLEELVDNQLLKNKEIVPVENTSVKEHFRQVAEKKDEEVKKLRDTKSDAARLATFNREFPTGSCTFEDLANNRFIHYGRKTPDEIQCVDCCGTINSLTNLEELQERHTRLYPGCPGVTAENKSPSKRMRQF